MTCTRSSPDRYQGPEGTVECQLCVCVFLTMGRTQRNTWWITWYITSVSFHSSRQLEYWNLLVWRTSESKTSVRMMLKEKSWTTTRQMNRSGGGGRRGLQSDGDGDRLIVGFGGRLLVTKTPWRWTTRTSTRSWRRTRTTRTVVGGRRRRRRKVLSRRTMFHNVDDTNLMILFN